MQQVQDAAQHAQQHSSSDAPRPALHIRGGGSKAWLTPQLGQPALPQPGVQWLHTDGLRGIVDYAPSELVITAGAGTPLAELESALAERGQYLPFEPPHFARANPNGALGATVGGLVASGLAGPARAAVGSVRDHVLGLHLLNGRGEHLQFGGQVIKNVAGYDISRLMVGAMGTLGVITQVSLKVLARPVAEATLCLPLSQADALAQLQRWGGQALPLNASCWVHDTTGADAAHSSAAASGQDLLFVRLRGARAAVESACQRMLVDALLLPQSPGSAQAHHMEASQAAADWALCREQQLPFFTQAPHDALLWRLSVPAATPALDWPYPTLVEWHGALRWVWAPAAAAQQVQQTAWRAGGSATVFIAAAACPVSSTARFGMQSRVAYGPPAATSAQALWQIACRVKDAFDPWGLFNPALFSRKD
ncbi:glycolate oxidase subunit GlcE [Curvibacter sp. CHRR-16]|nr:glycolate oxidase subunit GlcE [Curvibacter sp. CHRR-16]